MVGITRIKAKMGRTPLRKRTKQWITKRIVLAAAELTKAWGYHPTTMGASPKKRKPARGTLLNYFLSKEAKLLPWGQEILEQQVRPWLRTYLSTQAASWPVFQFPFAKVGDDLRWNTGISIRRSCEKRRALAFSRLVGVVMDFQQIIIPVLRYRQE